MPHAPPANDMHLGFEGKARRPKSDMGKVGLRLFIKAACLVLVAGFFQLSKCNVGAALPNSKDLPAQEGLPDPLVMFDGRKVTSREMWFNERRPELIRLFQHYMYGQLPPKPAIVS